MVQLHPCGVPPDCADRKRSWIVHDSAQEERLQVAIEVPVDPGAPAAARDLVTSALADVSIPQERFEDLRLLTSEIVTNVVQHAGLKSGDSIALGVEVYEDRVRVNVADDGPGFDPSDLPEPSPERAGGWGLHLLTQLSDEWGVIRNERNLVWFEVRL